MTAKRLRARTGCRIVSVLGTVLILFVAVAISALSQAQVGVKAGDQITYSFAITGAPSGIPLPTSLDLEVLSVQGTVATLRLTVNLDNGTSDSNDATVNIATGEQTGGPSGAIQGLVVPANLTTGNSVPVSGLGSATIDGETARVYAGASRTVVHTTFSVLGINTTYHWDKQTGIMVELSSTLFDLSVKAVSTNMWGPDAAFTAFLLQPLFLAIIAGAIIAVVAAVYFLKRRRPLQ